MEVWREPAAHYAGLQRLSLGVIWSARIAPSCVAARSYIDRSAQQIVSVRRSRDETLELARKRSSESEP